MIWVWIRWLLRRVRVSDLRRRAIGILRRQAWIRALLAIRISKHIRVLKVRRDHAWLSVIILLDVNLLRRGLDGLGLRLLGVLLL